MKNNNLAYDFASEEQVYEDEVEHLENRYLTFSVGAESFALNIQNITEILVIQEITHVPDLPESMKGVITLRDRVIPVMDIRTRFRMDHKPYDDRTCIIVTDSEHETTGLIVDAVKEVVDIPSEMIDPPPHGNTNGTGNYVLGLGKLGKDVKIVLDIDKVLVM